MKRNKQEVVGCVPGRNMRKKKVFKRINPYRILQVTLNIVVCIALISGALFGINTFLKSSSTPIEYAITVAYFVALLHFAVDRED